MRQGESATTPCSAGQWLARLRTVVPPASLREIYGDDADNLADRQALLRRVLEAFHARFGDLPVRVFRAPGRINLRGMHVDTHGGYLNLMTHQREVLVAAARTTGDSCGFTNLQERFPEVGLPKHPRSPEDRSAFPAGHWGNYLEGALDEVRNAAQGRPLPAICAMVGSDLSPGTGLSSSHALCLATLEAVAALSDIPLDARTKILAARQSEWHAGARTGVSDQTPMVLARRGALLSVALLAEDLDLSGARHITFPEAVQVLVVDSRTQRSLSGADQVAYTKNRFAYSAALHLFRHACREAGIADAAEFDRLSRITPERFGGHAAIYELLQRIPQKVFLDELQNRFGLEAFAPIYASFFGHLPQEQRPQRFHMRGPLLFGLAESERARLFPAAIEAGDFARAGRFMTTGHNGDRRVHPEGGPYDAPADDTFLARLVRGNVPIERVPGAYGASSPALDGIVDAALEAGALGACLTGGGIAGSVLALCRTEDAAGIAEELHKYLASPAYAERRPHAEPLSPKEAKAAVVVNHSTACAGEVLPPT